MLEFTIPGEPVAKQRPRVTRRGIAYTPKKTVDYENRVRLTFSEKYGNHVPFACPLRAEISVYMIIPESKSQKQKAQMKSGWIRPVKKPDLDNVAKSVLDSLNGLAYLDDKQIVELEIKKYYCNQDVPQPCAKVRIEDVCQSGQEILF